MPGISDNNTQPINTAPIAAIGSEQPVAPALNDFMQAFRSGFITVDDLTRRTKQSVTDTSNMQTTLSANDLTRRKAAAETQLLPGQLAEAQTQQEIQAATAPARLGMAQEQADKFARYQADPEKFIADETDEKTRNIYIQAKGPLPSVLMVKNPAKRPAFSEWAAAPLAEAAERGDSVTEDKLLDEYNAAFPEKIAARKGTPEYAMALRNEVDTLAKGKDLYAAKLKAAPGILEKRAIGGTPRFETIKRINAAGEEEEVSISMDPTSGEILGETVLAKNPPKLTEVQSNATIFSVRMNQNDKTLTALEQKGFDPSALATTAQKFLPNRFKSDEVQAYTAAKDNWISAILRKESGAAISAPEYAQANKEYFPRDGDSPAVVKQKQDLRKVAEEQIRKAGGARTVGPVGVSGGPGAIGIQAPSAGSKRVIQNGVTFEWNGSAYVPVQ